VRDQFLLSDHELQQELMRITDHHTLALFAAADTAARVVAAPVSRLVVDVERFASDAEEPMAARGMGAIYSMTSQNTPLRRPLTATEREALMQTWYYPHHARLEQAVDNALAEHGRCLVLDCHSFPDQPLPYEMANPAQQRPDICIGTDSFHTPAALTAALVEQFSRAGLSVKLNDPFAGALVPISRYRKDARVSAVMVEVNRKLYMEEGTGERLAVFEKVAGLVRLVVHRGCSA
jgi:N-formylglutamate amidohydrolase